MKVTAIIPDSLIREVQRQSGGKNITESITIALKEWRNIKRLKMLNRNIEKKPLALKSSMSYLRIREVNRKA
jgi:hypothetical protein